MRKILGFDQENNVDNEQDVAEALSNLINNYKFKEDGLVCTFQLQKTLNLKDRKKLKNQTKPIDLSEIPPDISKKSYKISGFIEPYYWCRH